MENVQSSEANQKFFDSARLFHQLLCSQTESFESFFKQVNLNQGEFLFQRGDKGDAIYIVETGKLEVYTVDQNGSELTLNTITTGEIVGELSVLDGQPRSATVRAVNSCILYRLDRENFLKLIAQSSTLNEYLIQLLSTRLRYTTEYIERLGHWARLIVEGRYDDVISIISNHNVASDRALIAASASMEKMVKAVQQRESELRQQVTRLTIEIDHEKRCHEVETIVQSAYFQDVIRLAEEMEVLNPEL